MSASALIRGRSIPFKTNRGAQQFGRTFFGQSTRSVSFGVAFTNTCFHQHRKWGAALRNYKGTICGRLLPGDAGYAGDAAVCFNCAVHAGDAGHAGDAVLWNRIFWPLFGPLLACGGGYAKGIP